MELKTYGLELANPTGDYLSDQLALECFAFRTGRTRLQGGLGKFQHFKNIVDLLWNNKELKCHKRFVWNSWNEQFIRNACQQRFLGVAGCRNSGKSDSAALWAIVNYIADPTHCLVMVMSTSIKGAKKRIWKYFVEYWQAIPNLPGKFLRSYNLVQGVNYDGKTFGESSGVILMAGEQSAEADALDKIIGIKAPRTQGDDGREGTLILIIDEMTGVSESVLHAAMQNLDGNANFQLIGLGNPDSHFDTFGIFCKPKAGWPSVTVNSYEWETECGGMCMRLDAELSPRITEGRDDCTWLPSHESIRKLKDDYGANSVGFYRFGKGFWAPVGSGLTIYSEVEIIKTGSQGKVTWGMERPTPCAFFDPAFTADGDQAVATFGKCGVSSRNLQTLLVTEPPLVIKIDVTRVKDEEPSYQLVRQYKDECRRRGIDPKHAGFDVSGATSFGDIMHKEWSKDVLGINNGGMASTRPASALNKKPASEVYADKVTEIWHGAKQFFRSGQIRGVCDEIAKELCKRQAHKNKRGENTRKEQVESKRVFKAREKESPNKSDSFLGLVELCRQRLNFKPVERAASPEVPDKAAPELRGEDWMIAQYRAGQAANKGKKVLRVQSLDYHGN
jgi:hypothetical protein